MGNNKNTGRLKRIALQLLGRRRARDFLASLIRRQTAGGVPLFSFPLDTGAITKVLVILPPSNLQVLHQLENIAALKAFFRNAEITLLCETLSVPLARMVEGTAITEYALKEKRLFSSTFSGFNRSFSGGVVEVCCLLTGSEDVPLLYLAGRTGAPVRAGYAGAGIFPFINLHVRPSPERTYLTDRNCAMAEALGAGTTKRGAWPVARQPRVEIDHFLKDNRHPRSAGIDALFFHRVFGAEQAKGIIKAMVPFANNAFYLYADKIPDAAEIQWLSQFDLPCIRNITTAQIASLVSSSTLIVSGNTLLFGFAALLGKKAIGIFKKDELDTYCPKMPWVRSIVYDRESNAETVSEIIRAVAELSSK